MGEGLFRRLAIEKIGKMAGVIASQRVRPVNGQAKSFTV